MVQHTRYRAKLLSRPLLVKNFEDSANSQAQSGLFRLPSEIRNRIYEEALVGKTDLMQPRIWLTDYYKPCDYDGEKSGYKKHISINILLTCKRIYLDAARMPVSFNEHTFWTGLSCERPHNVSLTCHPQMYFDQMAPWQQKLVRKVRIVDNIFWFEGSGKSNTLNFEDFCAIPAIKNITSLTVDIQNSDLIFTKAGKGTMKASNWENIAILINRLPLLEEFVINYELRNAKMKWIPMLRGFAQTARFDRRSGFVQEEQCLNNASSTEQHSTNSTSPPFRANMHKNAKRYQMRLRFSPIIYQAHHDHSG